MTRPRRIATQIPLAGRLALLGSFLALALALVAPSLAEALSHDEVAPDPTYGTAGSFTWVHPGSDRVSAIKVLADGSAVFAGSAMNGAAAQAVVCRVNALGALDTGFGSAGCAAPVGGTGESSAAALDIDHLGRVLVAGTANESGPTEGYVVRLLASGQPDFSYDAGGRRDFDGPGSIFSPVDVDALPGGSVLVTGSSYSVPTLGDFRVWKTLPTGEDDTAFGAPDGYVITDIEGEDDAEVLVLDGTSGFYVAGSSRTTVLDKPRVAVARYDSAGEPDLGFGTDGSTIWRPANFSEAAGVAALVQANGRLVLAGQARINGGSMFSAILRYLPNGSLDPTFGASGVALPAPSHNGVEDLLAAPGGRLWVVTTVNGASIESLTADGAIDSPFPTGSHAAVSDTSNTAAAAIDSNGRLLLASLAGTTATGHDIRITRAALTTKIDPVAHSKIRKPSKKRISRRKFTSVSGSADSGGSAIGVKSVSVTIRLKDAKRLKRGKCVWIRANGKQKVTKARKGRCLSSQPWIKATGTKSWKLKFKRKLERGSYEFVSRALLEDGRWEQGPSAKAGNLRSFTVTR